MTDTHKGLPVAGYKPQEQWRVDLVHYHKVLEEQVLRQLDHLKAMEPGLIDQRMVALAFTGIQDAFMWANRAVFQPARIELPEDDEDA